MKTQGTPAPRSATKLADSGPISTKYRTTCRMPLGFEAGDSNFYRYVNNNPTNNWDPSGLAVISLRDAPGWLRDLIRQEGVTGGRGTIQRVVEINTDFSHGPGADGSPVPAHFDVDYVDENGRDRRQRFHRDAQDGGRRAFTEDENANVTHNRETSRALRRQRRQHEMRGGPPTRSTIVQNVGTLSLPIVPAVIGLFRAGDGNPVAGFNHMAAGEIGNHAGITLSTAAALHGEYGISGMRGLIHDLGRMNRSELTPTRSITIRQQVQYGLNADISEWINGVLRQPNYREVTIENPPNLVNPTYSSIDLDPAVLNRLLDLDVDWHEIEMSVATRRNGSTDLQRSRALASIGLITDRLRQEQREGESGISGGGGDWGGGWEEDVELDELDRRRALRDLRTSPLRRRTQ